jgi:hypothetical protein
LLPRIDMRFSSLVIESVGNATWISSPPRKNGDSRCSSGESIDMRHVSSHKGGTVTRRFSFKNTIA